MDTNRTQWNDNQKQLRKLLKQPERLNDAIQLFLAQHAPLHAREVSGEPGWNLEEEIWAGLDEAAFRCVPAGQEHSIAWCTWHLARIEDATMNVLVAGSDQVFSRDNWLERLHAPFLDTGNLITGENVQLLSEQVDWLALREYRSAVGKRTREIVSNLTAADITRKTPMERLQRGLDEGVIAPYATGLVDYWGSLTVAGLLLMPPTRHNFIHLTECLKLKHKTLKTRTSK